MAFDQLNDGAHIWRFFKSINSAHNKDVLAQILHGDAVLIIYVRHIPDAHLQEKYSFMQHMVVFQVMQERDW